MCAQEARWQLALDAVWLMPTGEPPHKAIDRDPGREERLRLCELAAAGADGDWLSASSHEIERPGPSFTVETLGLLRDQGVADELVLLLGADQAASLPSWREPDEVLRLAALGVARRAGVDEQAVRETLASLAGGERAIFFGMPLIDVSSSDVRARAAEGRPYRFLVPERVADRIAERGLYGGSAVAEGA